MKVPNYYVETWYKGLSLSRLQNEGSQQATAVIDSARKSIKATE